MTQDDSCSSSVLQVREAAITSRNSKRAHNSVFLGVLKQRFPPDLQQLPHSTASSYYQPTTAAWTAFKGCYTAKTNIQSGVNTWGFLSSPGRREKLHLAWNNCTKVFVVPKENFYFHSFPPSHPKMLLPNPRVWEELRDVWQPQGKQPKIKVSKKRRKQVSNSFFHSISGSQDSFTPGLQITATFLTDFWSWEGQNSNSRAASLQDPKESVCNRFALPSLPPRHGKGGSLSPHILRGFPYLPLCFPSRIFPLGSVFAWITEQGEVRKRSQSCAPAVDSAFPTQTWGSDCWKLTERF